NRYVGLVLQRRCECGASCEECKEEPLQRKGEGPSTTTAGGLTATLRQSGSGERLDAGVRERMESGLGHDFSDVRVHADGGAADAARRVRAQAFTTGSHIYFGGGRYQPHSSDGQRLIAHELSHVVQQRTGAVAPVAAKPVIDTPGDPFEREADAAAEQVMAGRSADASAVGRGSPPA